MSNERDAVSDDVKNRQSVIKKLKIACLLCASFLIVEVIGGIWSGSLAVLSDAAHLMADLASFAVAIGASYLAGLPSNSQHTFGLKRSESLAALFSMASLTVVSIWLSVEALQRGFYIVNNMEDKIAPIDGKLMSSIAALGVVVNVVLALVLGEHHVHMPGHDHSSCDGGHHDHDHSGGGHDHSSEDKPGHDHSCDDGGSEDKQHSSCKDDDDAAHDHEHSHNHRDEKKDDVLEDNTTNGHAHAVRLTESFVDKLTVGGHSYGAIEDHNHEVPKPATKTATERKENINLNAAYLHVMGDLAQSFAVLIAGLVIWKKPEWRIIDPLTTLIFCTIVLYSTISVLRASVSVLLEEVPPTMNWGEINEGITSVPGVSNVHCLHIWSISHGEPTLSVHASAVNVDTALVEINRVCRKFGIHHATVQVQSVFTGACATCSDEFGGNCV